jgi:Tol biopolymer transport system component
MIRHCLCFRCLAVPALCAVALCTFAGAQENKRSAIFVIKADGTGMRRVVKMPDYAQHGSPRWSHNGKQLAFDAIHRANRIKKIFVVNVDGTELKEVADAAMPDWSPDDKQLAVFSREAYQGNLQPGIYAQNVDGQGQTRLADGEGPRWSPDGSKIACTDNVRLFTVDLVSGEQQDVLDEPFDQIRVGYDWSPNGKQLAFVGRTGNGRDLILVNVGDSNRTKRSRLHRNLLDGHVSWSPDGKRLVFSMLTSIYVIDVDQGDPQRVPGVKGDAYDPSWSPDGAWITFSGNHEPAP